MGAPAEDDVIKAADALKDAKAALAVVQATRAAMTDSLNTLNAQIASADANVKQAMNTVIQARTALYKLLGSQLAAV